MKKIIIISLLIILPFAFFSAGAIFGDEGVNSFQGKIIALDAGHGGDELGATNDIGEVVVYEKDVNLAVVYTLEEKLKADGACVVLTRVCDETISSRKERVAIAKEKCESECGGGCDVLVSVHHNGSIEPEHNGTSVYITQKKDKKLGQALLDALIPLTNNNEGLHQTGMGMTVFGGLVSALTEAYYITNDGEAEQYLDGTSTEVCSGYPVLIGNRINQETDALYQGLFDYFNLEDDGNKCPPGKAKQDKC